MLAISGIEERVDPEDKRWFMRVEFVLVDLLVYRASLGDEGPRGDNIGRSSSASALIAIGSLETLPPKMEPILAME